MTTLVPTPPLVGLKLVIVGAAMTVKEPALVAVPPGVVTPIGPVTAPEGTVAVICVDELTVKDVADTPPKVTEVAPVRFVPVITTLAPTAPLVGEKLVIVGAPMTVKDPALVAVPPGVVTLIGPVTAPDGTVAVICVDEFTVKDVADTPPNFTEVAPVRFVPVMTTLVPTDALVGLKLVIVGEPTTVKLLALVAVPPGVVTAIGPVVAPLGTVAVI